MNMSFMQRVVGQWCARAFGVMVSVDRKDRSIRIVEEATELCQYEGVDPAVLHKLIDVVFSRPIGFPYQEMGGIAVTSLAYCEASGMSFESCLEQEVERILDKDISLFRARQAEKVALGVSNEKLVSHT